jgi:hypothetical protein
MATPEMSGGGERSGYPLLARFPLLLLLLLRLRRRRRRRRRLLLLLALLLLPDARTIPAVTLAPLCAT